MILGSCFLVCGFLGAFFYAMFAWRYGKISGHDNVMKYLGSNPLFSRRHPVSEIEDPLSRVYFILFRILWIVGLGCFVSLWVLTLLRSL